MSDATRPAQLPAGVAPYRTIGPFDAESLPSGLLKSHSLADGVWGVVSVEKGGVYFVWEDGAGECQHLAAPAELIVPPKAPHHLKLDGEVSLSVIFCRV